MIEYATQQLDMQLHIAAITGVAALFGAMIGWEREVKRRSAGLCTHALIASACALFIELSQYGFFLGLRDFPATSVRIEPASAIEGVVIAIGFIAGGAVLKIAQQEKVANLTTACTVVWAGAIGIAVGYELIVLALACAVLVLAINGIGGWIEARLIRRAGNS